MEKVCRCVSKNHPHHSGFRRYASIVGVPGIEPGHQDPQPCVLPIYDTPICLIYPSERAAATGAGVHARAVGQLRFLEVGVFPRPVGGVIMAVQKLPGAGHYRSLEADHAAFHRKKMIP